MTTAPTIEHVPAERGDGSGELVVRGEDGALLGELTWVMRPAPEGSEDRRPVMVILHTGVREGLRGGGWAGKLVDEAVALAEREGWAVLPQCSYAAHRIAKRAAG